MPWALEVIACRMRAHAYALAGDPARADAALAELATLARHPYRRRDFDGALNEAICAILLGRPAEAALDRAFADALHPIEKHVAHYWAHEAARRAGREDDARAHAQALLDDGIQSWMRNELG